MIKKDVIDKIYLTADVVEVIGDFISLQKKGVNYQACCPFHGEKTPSFVVSPSKGIYKCFGCGKGGNSITFVMEHEGLTYVDALKYVARKYGIEVIEEQMTDENRHQQNERENMMGVTQYAANYFSDKLINSSEGKNVGLTYFRERGFTDATIEKFQLGYCPSTGDAFSRKALEDGYLEKYLTATGLTIKRETGGYYDRFTGRVIFPITSISGRVIGFGGRILTSDKNKAKYLNSPESDIYHKSQTLYGIFQAKKAITANNRCILVEGYADVISMHQSGIENVVASSGTSLTEDQIRLIARFTKNVTIIYDGDSAGIKASMRGIDMLLKEGLNVRIVPLPDGEDPDSFARSHSSSQTNQYIFDNEEDFISFKAKLLISEVKNDPIGRATVITEIVNSIGIIPNEVVRVQYVKECSRLLDQDESLIAREVAKRVVSLTSGKQGLDVLRNEERKRRFQEKQNTTISSSNMPMGDMPPDDLFYEDAYSTTDTPLNKDAQYKALYELEKELITYIIRDGNSAFYFTQPRQEPIKLNVSDTIMEEMTADELEFMHPLYNELYNSYKTIYEQTPSDEDTGEHENIPISQFVNHTNPLICDLVVHILTLDDMYKHSRMWSKHSQQAVEVNNLSVGVPKAIALYKLKRLEVLISEKKKELKQMKEFSGDLMKELNMLNESRKEILKSFERIL